MARILVAEDEVVICLQLKKWLRKMGYLPVGQAVTGREALKMAKELRPDVVLMDVGMPGDLDGIAAAEIITQELNIPIIFVTGYSEEQIRERTGRVAPVGHIDKPFNYLDIKTAIEVALMLEPARV
ncbi:MAG: response regulator [Deltaproteobacteria bacterium]|nr:response regulator [Deltaproteobacteria bacterium]